MTSARETPSMAAISGTISVRAISAAASRPSSEVAPMDAMMTGEALMLRADAVGSTLSGRPASAMPSSMAASASLTSVPYSNWAMTRAIELAEVDWTVFEPRHAGDGALDRHGDLVGDVLRAGARVGGDDGDDRELDVGQELLLEAAPGRDAGDEQGAGQQERDAPLADGELGETIHERSPCGSVVVAGLDVGGDGRVEDADGALDDREVRGVDVGEQLAHPARVELPERLQGRLGLGRGGDDDLAPVGGVLVADQQAVRHSPSTTPVAVDEVTPSRAASSDIRSWPAATTRYRALVCDIVRSMQVQLGGVGRHQAMHQAVEGRERCDPGRRRRGGARRGGRSAHRYFGILRTIGQT